MVRVRRKVSERVCQSQVSDERAKGLVAGEMQKLTRLEGPKRCRHTPDQRMAPETQVGAGVKRRSEGGSVWRDEKERKKRPIKFGWI